MGCFVSTNSTNSSSTMSNADLTSSYEDACQSDPELQSFDSTLQHQTTTLINNLAVGPEVRSLSLNSLRQLTGTLLDTNQEVVKRILECKHDIWQNDHLFNLVQLYFEISLQTLDFCTSLQNCLKNARSNLSFIEIAISQYDSNTNQLHILEQFKEFNGLELDNPFTNESFELFQSVYEKQMTMLKNIQNQKGKVDKKLKLTKTWRRLSNVIFVTTFSTVLICSVVAAAVSAPPLVTALAAAAAVPLGSMGKWVSSLWKKYEKEFRDQKGVMSAMQNADFVIREEDVEGVGVVVDEMKTTVSMFAKTIDDLSDHSDKCIRDTRRARTMILQRIIKHPSDSL
ncbi:hypothetical protein HanPI659440_Chr14g0559611 [Helianthus annuus]|nr:hypothetical protein HanPI659440_Chr14g0559611 [Helianthus annuus]